MANLNAKQLGALASLAAFTPDESVTAMAIALAESGGNPNATHKNRDGSTDKGLWQINDKANADIIAKDGNVFAPHDNAVMAHDIYKRQGWKAWSTYTDGAYLLYMDPIHVADAKNGIANNVGTDIPGSTITAKAPSALDNVMSAIQSPLNAVGSALQVLTSPATWLRVALIVGGALIIVAGLVFMIESDKSVQSATKLAALA